ncbi:cation diffusion facilitator family transporter [Leptolyngbyaceae cyanobacterium UHCC 1019]
MFDSTSQKPLPKVRSLTIAWSLVVLTATADIAIGAWSHSLALIADSGHLFADAATFGLSVIAAWWVSRRQKVSTGTSRLEAIAALVNGVGLLGIALELLWSGLHRLGGATPEILSVPMVAMAGISLIANVINVRLLHGHSHQDLNVQGVFLHLLGDLVSSIGVLLAAIAVWLWHWTWADSAISLVVAIIVGVSAFPLIRRSLQFLRTGAAIADLSQTAASSCLCCTPAELKKLLQPKLEELI